MTDHAGGDEVVEAVAEALHDREYPAWSATACRDHNRWSCRGAGDDPADPKPAMGHLGPNGETTHYDEYREQARAAIDAARPLIERQVRAEIAAEIGPILLGLSDTLDSEEGPVILAWSTPVLAARIAARIARGSATAPGEGGEG